MPILKQTQTPFGAALGFHVAMRAEIDLAGVHQVAIVAVASWPAESDYIAADGRGAAWNWQIPVPLAAIDGGGVLASLEAALIADAASPFLGGAAAPFPSGVEAARARQWARIKQTRDILNSLPITFDGVTIDGDNASRQNVMGAIMAMQLIAEIERYWICADNVRRLLTLAQIIGLGTALAARTQELVDIGDALRAQINDPSKTTVAEVEAVVWPVAPAEAPTPE